LKPAGSVHLFVNGTLMRGEELHENLAGARFSGELTTAPRYRLFSVDDRHPAMVRDDVRGAAIAGELYDVPLPVLGTVLEREPAGLGLDVVELADGQLTLGVMWLAAELPPSARDISEYGDWRRYRAAATGTRLST
jgi:adenine/guanine/hypoxanthine permease